MTTLDNILTKFDPISLEEMDTVKLLNRVDTKYVLSNGQFLSLLQELIPHYRSLEIKGLRTARYRSLYFDTDDFDHYMDHHNGYPDRYKIRIRRYVDSDLCFLEIKHKKKGRTDKRRIPIEDFELDLSDASIDFISQIIPEAKELRPSLWNSFKRITLVNQELKERLTFDVGLHFKEGINSDQDLGYDDIVIAEVKQERENRNSPIMKLLKANGIRKARVSKYCIGMGLTTPGIKKNRFKQKYLLIDKIRRL
jgi:hypothetical protein